MAVRPGGRRSPRKPRARGSITLILGLLVAACGPDGASGRGPGDSGVRTVVDLAGDAATELPTCARPHRTGTLPGILREASGIAASRRRPGIFWTHNDSGHPAAIFAVDSTGQIIDQVRVRGARNRDWEDIAIGPCPTGECIYLADTGDNRLRHDDAVIYRFPEPAPGDSVTGRVEKLPIRYPDGPRDIEALYILPDGGLYLISKGRRHPVEIFRYPPPLTPGDTVIVELVQRLTDRGVALPYRLTGAAATSDGRWVAVRTYGAVQLYRTRPDGTLTPALPPPGIDLQDLLEPQGEGVEILDDGRLFLISEAGPAGVPGILGRLECRLD